MPPPWASRIVKAPASTSAEVQAAAQSLIGRADAIMVIGDNTAVSALESIIKVAEQNQMPLVAGDPDSVKRGAVAAYGFDYYDLGKQTGAMAAKVLSGTPVARHPGRVRREPAALHQREGRRGAGRHHPAGPDRPGRQQVLSPVRDARRGAVDFPGPGPQRSRLPAPDTRRHGTWK